METKENKQYLNVHNGRGKINFIKDAKKKLIYNIYII